MAKDKKIPLRTCIVCREMKEKGELIRVVHQKDGKTAVDLVGKANGRGAYICKSRECIEKARKSSALSRAFKCEVEDAVYDMLLREGL